MVPPAIEGQVATRVIGAVFVALVLGVAGGAMGERFWSSEEQRRMEARMASVERQIAVQEMAQQRFELELDRRLRSMETAVRELSAKIDRVLDPRSRGGAGGLQ